MEYSNVPRGLTLQISKYYAKYPLRDKRTEQEKRIEILEVDELIIGDHEI